MKIINILGISGSLRSDSTNVIILRVIESLLPENVTFQIFNGLGEMPHFSPGLEERDAVMKFKRALQLADAVIISTPEYAFGVPGTLKNALDWTVATGEFNEKPVAAISASPLNTGGDKALASLLLTLTALGTVRNENSYLSIPNVKSKIVEGKIADQNTIELLKILIANLLYLIHIRS
ncbi:NADPH-dependent FMN reductase [Dyadobacter sp. CY343]|uniref:NADPH-dependent FMN reductase n=1 Tax=Dyadobacter sp. CY343 TaxID=2907299 RepID=UPI001F332BF4|nr:NAD(P)H-dependent oxidoreductase [Dyadobacter sp. CY343]MCE7060419.1 NAD(P)H-dependent oxidoreductase [Dyadobacter sp. CY343]